VVTGHLREQSIISGTSAAIWPRTNFGPTGHHNPRSCAYATFPALLPFLNASWKSCSMSVLSTTCDSTLIISTVQNGGLLFLSSIGETEKFRVSGEGQSCCFWSQILWWKRQCEMVRCRDATARTFVAKVRGEVFVYFHAVTVKRHSSMWNWLLGLTGQILCEQSPWCHKHWWARSWLCSSPVSTFSVCPEPNTPI
jgi:hypothetical protein